MTARLGDQRSTEMVRAHDAIVRRALKDALGREVKHTGDGIMATFDEADRAVSCSRSIQSGIDAFNMASAEKLNLRIGMDAGEPVAENDDLFGSDGATGRPPDGGGRCRYNICHPGNP